MASTTPYRATVLGLLLAMGIVMALSVRDDTLTTDEGLYIPTGYLYVTEHNARIRFENPSRRNIVLFGTVFAGAQLVKFALLSMLPFLAGLLVLWTLLHRGAEDRWLAGTVRLALEFAAALGVSGLS